MVKAVSPQIKVSGWMMTWNLPGFYKRQLIFSGRWEGWVARRREVGHCGSSAIVLFLSLTLVIFINRRTVASLLCMAGMKYLLFHGGGALVWLCDGFGLLP